MQNHGNTIAANRRLAGLLGWTNIVEVEGALLGSPPAGAPECRGQAQVPDWAGDWGHAGPLLAQFEIRLTPMTVSIDADGFIELYRRYSDKDVAARAAIVKAAAFRLEHGQ